MKRDTKVRLAVVVAALAAILGAAWQFGDLGKVAKKAEPIQVASDCAFWHQVQPGDIFTAVAERYGFDLDTLIEINTKLLSQWYPETCRGLPVSYTKNARRRGHFCNDLKARPFVNTLVPGQPICIPGLVTIGK